MTAMEVTPSRGALTCSMLGSRISGQWQVASLNGKAFCVAYNLR
jgi:hypothetical protein